MLDRNGLSEVVSEETQRHQEQLNMERTDEAACVVLLDAIPAEARRALARRAGDTVFQGETEEYFFLWPTKPYRSPSAWCWWQYSFDDPFTLMASKSAVGFDVKGRLVEVFPIAGGDEYGTPELWFSAREVDATDAVALMPHGDGCAEALAGRLNDGLQETLTALRQRRQRLAEVKAVAEALAAAIGEEEVRT